MPFKVRTEAANVSLPNGKTYPSSNTTVTLTDAEYGQLSSTVFASGKLTDLGPVSVDGDLVDTQAPFVAQPAALTSTQEATVNGSDLATTQALANSLKAKYNALQVDVVAIQAKLTAVMTALKGLDKPMAPS